MKKNCTKEKAGDVLYPNEELDGDEQRQEEGEEGPQGEEEVRRVKQVLIPNTPSRTEVLEHRLTHRPFRSWCPHCVRGKGRPDQHRASPQKKIEQVIPKVVCDYFYVGKKRPADRLEREAEEKAAEQDGQTPVLTIRDTKSKALFSHACPCKGAHESVVNKVIADLNLLGYKRILVKSDGENPLLDLWAKIKENGTVK